MRVYVCVCVCFFLNVYEYVSVFELDRGAFDLYITLTPTEEGKIQCIVCSNGLFFGFIVNIAGHVCACVSIIDKYVRKFRKWSDIKHTIVPYTQVHPSAYTVHIIICVCVRYFLRATFYFCQFYVLIHYNYSSVVVRFGYTTNTCGGRWTWRVHSGYLETNTESNDFCFMFSHFRDDMTNYWWWLLFNCYYNMTYIRITCS